MNTKYKLEIEMNEANYLAIIAIAGKRRLSISETINDLVSDALEKVDPRDLVTNANDEYLFYGDKLTDEFSVISDLIADKF